MTGEATDKGDSVAVPDAADGRIRILLTGDVMTARGIDQVLPRPGNPRIHESAMRSALGYVALAERANGAIPRPVPFDYVWGDALAELDRHRPDVRVINLETAVTADGLPEPKGINYRMNPDNLPVIAAAGIDCCVLANNHVLDWGVAGLRDTLAALDRAGLARAGAGRDLGEAERPAALDLGQGGGRVLVYACAVATSGVPDAWRAGAGRPGVNLLSDLSPRTVRAIARRLEAVRRPGDVVVLSIHWGANWGYRVGRDEQDFARGVIDEAGVDIVHGHSAHHVKAIEVYRRRPILYGCGDFLNDYEGIGGHEAFRPDLALMYFADLDGATGALAALEMVPLRIFRFQLMRVGPEDAAWLAEVLTREGAQFKTRARVGSEGCLRLEWA